MTDAKKWAEQHAAEIEAENKRLHELSESLQEIAIQVQSWLDWSKKDRAEEGLSTKDETHLIALPVPYWPSHGQLSQWVKVLVQAADNLPTGGPRPSRVRGGGCAGAVGPSRAAASPTRTK